MFYSRRDKKICYKLARVCFFSYRIHTRLFSYKTGRDNGRASTHKSATTSVADWLIGLDAYRTTTGSPIQMIEWLFMKQLWRTIQRSNLRKDEVQLIKYPKGQWKWRSVFFRSVEPSLPNMVPIYSKHCNSLLHNGCTVHGIHQRIKTVEGNLSPSR